MHDPVLHETALWLLYVGIPALPVPGARHFDGRGHGEFS